MKNVFLLVVGVVVATVAMAMPAHAYDEAAIFQKMNNNTLSCDEARAIGNSDGILNCSLALNQALSAYINRCQGPIKKVDPWGPQGPYRR